MSDETNITKEHLEKVSIKAIIPDIELPADIYVYLRGKFIKYVGCGDPFTSDRYNNFIAHKMTTVFIPKNQLQDFVQWLKDKKQALLEADSQKVGGQYRNVVEQNQELKELAFEIFTTEELSVDTVTQLQSQVSELLEIAQKDQKAVLAMARLAKYNQTLTDHSANVANLSVFLGMSCGHKHPLVLNNLYLGGLLHDFGKTKMDPKSWESGMNSQAERNHPEMGAQLLQKSGKFPDQVVTIVRQHHEAFAGGGFPKGLAGKKIYELARIVAVANIYDNVCMEKEHEHLDDKRKAEKALKVLEYDNGKKFDPAVLENCIKAIKIAYIELG